MKMSEKRRDGACRPDRRAAYQWRDRTVELLTSGGFTRRVAAKGDGGRAAEAVEVRAKERRRIDAWAEGELLTSDGIVPGLPPPDLAADDIA